MNDQAPDRVAVRFLEVSAVGVEQVEQVVVHELGSNISILAVGAQGPAGSGGGGGGSQPLHQIVFGTGTGVTSDAGFTYDPTTGILGLAGGNTVTASAIEVRFDMAFGTVSSPAGAGFTLFAGDSSADGFNGGAIMFVSGNGGTLGGVQSGGDIIFTTGGGSGGGNSGSISFTTGNADPSGGNAGSLSFIAGAPSEGDGGNVDFIGSAAAGSGNHKGGDVSFTAGAGINAGLDGSIAFNIPAKGTIKLNGNSGTAGFVLTSNGPATAPTWQPGGGGSSAQPLNQILFGTGTGVTSDAGFTYDPGIGLLTLLGGNTIRGQTGDFEFTAADGTGIEDGAAISFTGGKSGTGAGGGNLILLGGQGETQGGVVHLGGGDGLISGSSGGNVVIFGGAGIDNDGGTIQFNGGPATGVSGTGGSITFAGGPATEGDGGAITFTGGNASTATSTPHDGGNVSFNAGQGVAGGADGFINFNFQLGSTLRMNNDPGTAGFVLTSQGPGLPPVWAALP